MAVAKVQPVVLSLRPVPSCPKKGASFDLEATVVLCVQKCNVVDWCVMCAEQDVK